MSSSEYTRFGFSELEAEVLSVVGQRRPVIEPYRTFAVVDHQSRWDGIAHRNKIGKDRAEGLAAKFFYDSLKRDGRIIIDDRTHLMRYVLDSKTETGKHIIVTALPTFKTGEAKTTRINSPRFDASFAQGKYGMEFGITIHGTLHGKKIINNPSEVFSISSNGNGGPPAFSIYIGNDVVFARTDHTGSPGCALAYQGNTQWVMREQDGKYTAFVPGKAANT